MGIIGRALNFISLGGLDAAHRKVIKEEDVFGFNVQNFLGYIPLFNFFVGPGRVEKANNVLREYEHIDIDSLTDQDQEEINHCKAHRVRGVIETIPVVGLLIFIIPDVLYGIVKGVSSLMASKKESKPSSHIQNMKNHLRAISRSVNRLRSAKNEKDEIRCKNAITESAKKYCIELENYYKISEQNNYEQPPNSNPSETVKTKPKKTLKERLGIESTYDRPFSMTDVEVPTEKSESTHADIRGQQFAQQIFENLKKNKENIDD